MTDTKTMLQALCDAPGVGGMTEIATVAADLLRPLTDEVTVDAMGNVCGILRGTDTHAGTVMLEAHMDEIGMIVTAVEDNGFIRVAACGGVDIRVLSTAEVVVYGDRPYPGVVCSLPPHLTDAKERGKCPELGKMAIDVGLSGEDAKARIPLGSRVTFRPHFDAVGAYGVSAKALDDRAGIAALLLAAQTLSNNKPAQTVIYCFTVQEELGLRGAAVAAFDYAVSAAVSVDVSFGLTHDADKHACGICGDGPMIGMSPILDAEITKKLMTLAENGGIPYQREVMGETTGTNADRLSLTKNGIPCGLVSLPLKYMHTPQETIDLRDIENTAALLAAFVREG